MNANEINDEIRRWLTEHYPRDVGRFDDIVGQAWTAEGKLIRLAFKAGVAYQQSKDIPNLIHRGDDKETT